MCERKWKRHWGGRESWDAGLTPSEGEKDRRLGTCRCLRRSAALKKAQQGHRGVPEPMSPPQETRVSQGQLALASPTLSDRKHSTGHHRDKCLGTEAGGVDLRHSLPLQMGMVHPKGCHRNKTPTFPKFRGIHEEWRLRAIRFVDSRPQNIRP